MTDAVMVNASPAPPQVTQKPFDDFHLYDLHRTVALRDGETKQVQFLDAANVTIRRSYLFDDLPSAIQPIWGGGVNNQRGYGLDTDNNRVHIVQEIKNSEANHLGVPLPAGRLRMYRRDSDGQMEFVGESQVQHTPTDETVTVITGDAFDVKASRRQTDFHTDNNGHELEETFEIKVTNRKAQPVTVNLREHLYRCDNWDIIAKSLNYTKRDSHTIEFPVQVAANSESIMTYTVHYTW